MDATSKLWAIEEIKQLKSRYFRTMDTRDWKGMAQVFARDIIFEFPEGGKVTKGRDAVSATRAARIASSTVPIGVADRL